MAYKQTADGLPPHLADHPALLGLRRRQHHGPARVSGWRRAAHHRHDRSLLGGIQQLGRLGSRVISQRRGQTQLQIPPADPAHLARVGADRDRGLA